MYKETDIIINTIENENIENWRKLNKKSEKLLIKTCISSPSISKINPYIQYLLTQESPNIKPILELFSVISHAKMLISSSRYL